MAVIASQLIGKVEIQGSDKAKSDLKSVGEHADKAESSFKKLRETVARGFEFGTGMQLAQIPGNIFEGLKEQIGDVIKLAMDHQQIMSQTNQVLKSTHDVSKMTADALDELAQKFGRTTQFSADTVQSGENLLLTFTNIGKSVFPQATQAILDVSQAMGQDLKESAIQVGKALGDPLTGMTALQRIGVTFSAQEKEQIKTMMEHNNIIGAQKVILKELSTEFGGSADAAGKTFAGALKIAQDKVEELKIKIGTALMPILNEFLQYFEVHLLPRLDDFARWFQTDGIPKLQDFGKWFQTDGIPDLQQFGDIVGTAVTDLIHFAQWLHDGTPPAQMLTGAAIALGGAIAAVKIAGLVGDMKNFVAEVPEIVSKFFLVQQGAEAAAGAEGIAAIGTAATGAEGVVATAAAGMTLSLGGVVALIAGLGIASGLTIKSAIDTYNANVKAGYSVPAPNDMSRFSDVNRRSDVAQTLKDAAQNAKELAANIEQAWKDMEGLGDWAARHNHILGDLADPLVLDKTDTKIMQMKEHLDDLTKPLVLPSMVPFTADVEKARQKVIDLKAHLDDLKGPIAIEVGTRSVDAATAKIMYMKSQLDDTGGGSMPGHASGILNSPYGHWAMVGERGPEAMYVPRGSSILPNGSAIPSGGQGSDNAQQPIILSIDGVQFARVVMPHLTNQIRYSVGSVGY